MPTPLSSNGNSFPRTPVSAEARHVVVIAGGAVAGSEAASQLAQRGVVCIVLEQNDRPYGKIEDGLPRWHVKLRQAEMEKIDAKLSRPGVHFVPRTRLGRDLMLHDVLAWEPSAVVLAVGAWRDRPLPLPGIDQYAGRGFYYQNPLVYWFNHYPDPGFQGPEVELADGGLVVGGGLASLDVVKILMLETVMRAMAERGLPADLYELERVGIARALQGAGLTVEDLGLRGCTLYYRRRVEDMPLNELPEGATPAQAEQARRVRRRMLESFQAKYLFQVRDCRAPAGYLVVGDRVAGLKVAATEVHNGSCLVVKDSEEAVPSPIVVSSIGSIPEAIPGIEVRGHLYPVRDLSTGEVEGLPGVFAVGNAVTGKGNILVSQKQGRTVSQHMLERYLEGTASGYEETLAEAQAAAEQRVAAVARRLEGRPPLPAEQVSRILAAIRTRQDQVGYPGVYQEWMAGVVMK
jgi:NADPH-dependent glutamate synthase beta subunit-like oxidoreductase